jgi:hypothetical protein
VDVRWGEHESIENRIYCYGNCLQYSPGTASHNILHPTADGPDGPTFTEENVMRVRADTRTIRIRDTVVPISTDPGMFSAKGIALVNPPHIMAPDLLRSLVPTYRDWLFATEEELRERVPADLPLLLRLDAWHHPDLMEDEVPSETEAFQMLADMLVANDPSRYHPRTVPNTHWTHWPHGGTL